MMCLAAMRARALAMGCKLSKDGDNYVVHDSIGKKVVKGNIFEVKNKIEQMEGYDFTPPLAA